MNDRTPPQDVEAERCVLGAMMMSKEAIEDSLETLRESDFYRPEHGQIWDAVVDLHEALKPVDPVTVADELRKRGVVDKVGGAPYLHTLQAAAPLAASAGYYADIVREKAALRRAIDAFTRGLQNAYEGSESEAVIDQAQAELTGIPLRKSAGSTWGEIFPRVMDDLDSKEPPGIPLPWPELDRLVHGLRPGNMYMIAARPKVGKTLVGQAIALETAAVHNKTALYFTFEMSEEEMGYRIISDQANIPLSHLIDRNLNDFENVKMAELYRASSQWPIEIHDQPDMTVAQIGAIVRETARRTDLGVVIVDYLGLVKARDDKISREQQISEMSRALKVLSKKYHVPVVVLVQLNRGPENRVDKQPLASDMRDSGAQEQDATAVILLWRPPNESWVLKANVALNRFGEQDTVDLTFWGSYARVTSPEQEQRRKAVA